MNLIIVFVTIISVIKIHADYKCMCNNGNEPLDIYVKEGFVKTSNDVTSATCVGDPRSEDRSNNRKNCSLTMLTTEPTTEPITDQSIEPTTAQRTESTTEPTVKQTTEPITEPNTEPTTRQSIDPSTEQTSEPTTKQTTEPSAEPTTTLTTEQSTQIIAINNNIPTETTVLETTPTTPANMTSTPYLDSTTSALITSSTPNNTTSTPFYTSLKTVTTVTHAPTATTVLQGDPVTYENWKPGRKDYRYHDSEDCVYMTPDNRQWDDVECGATERPATIDSVTIQLGNISQDVIALCPNPVRQQSIKDQGILGQYNHNCYELIAHTYYPWNYAERICHSRGGHLAHIQNQQEQDYIQGFLQQHLPKHAVWIGLSDQQSEGHFQWSSSDAVVYTNWVPGHISNFVSHHDEDCVVIIPYKGGEWDDIPCGYEGTALFGGPRFSGETHPVICQYNTVYGAPLVG